MSRLQIPNLVQTREKIFQKNSWTGEFLFLPRYICLLHRLLTCMLFYIVMLLIFLRLQGCNCCGDTKLQWPLRQSSQSPEQGVNVTAKLRKQKKPAVEMSCKWIFTWMCHWTVYHFFWPLGRCHYLNVSLGIWAEEMSLNWGNSKKPSDSFLSRSLVKSQNKDLPKF